MLILIRVLVKGIRRTGSRRAAPSLALTARASERRTAFIAFDVQFHGCRRSFWHLLASGGPAAAFHEKTTAPREAHYAAPGGLGIGPSERSPRTFIMIRHVCPCLPGSVCSGSVNSAAAPPANSMRPAYSGGSDEERTQ